jgi:transcription antitermination factor NusA-like protein
MTPQDKQHILDIGFVPVINHGFQVNDRVCIKRTCIVIIPTFKEGFGQVIAIVGRGVELTKEEAMEVYQVSDDHKYIRNFMKPCKVDRIIVKRDDKDSNLVIPASRLGLELIEHV